VICASCGIPLASTAKSCTECEASVGVGRENSVSTGGGDIGGDVYQAQGNIVVNPAASTPPEARYEAVPMWRSPLTLALLTWASVALGVTGVFPLWQVVERVIDLFASEESADFIGRSGFAWLHLLLAVVLLLGLLLGLRRIAMTETRWPLRFGLAVSGHGRRITLEKIRADRCPKCRGKMKYYSKPIEWINHVDPNGRRWREITQRVPALECRRNSKHWYEVDPAEEEAA
jgi:hypothetical protein